MTIHPSFIGSGIEVLEGFSDVFIDVSTVQIHETQSGLTNRIIPFSRSFEILKGRSVVLRNCVAAFKVHLDISINEIHYCMIDEAFLGYLQDSCSDNDSSERRTLPCRGTPWREHPQHLLLSRNNSRLVDDLVQLLDLLDNATGPIPAVLLHHLFLPENPN